MIVEFFYNGTGPSKPSATTSTQIFSESRTYKTSLQRARRLLAVVCKATTTADKMKIFSRPTGKSGAKIAAGAASQ